MPPVTYKDFTIGTFFNARGHVEKKKMIVPGR